MVTCPDAQNRIAAAKLNVQPSSWCRAPCASKKYVKTVQSSTPCGSCRQWCQGGPEHSDRSFAWQDDVNAAVANAWQMSSFSPRSGCRALVLDGTKLLQDMQYETYVSVAMVPTKKTICSKSAMPRKVERNCLESSGDRTSGTPSVAPGVSLSGGGVEGRLENGPCLAPRSEISAERQSLPSSSQHCGFHLSSRFFVFLRSQMVTKEM